MQTTLMRDVRTQARRMTPGHGQLLASFREVLRLDRDDRAGESSFEPCANAVRAPPRHNCALTVRARSRTQGTEVDLQLVSAQNLEWRRRMPGADMETEQHDNDVTLARLPRTAPASEGPDGDSNRTLRVQGGAGCWQAQNSASLFHCVRPPLPQLSSASRGPVRSARDRGGQRIGTRAGL
eukprot:4083068-Prymnesium_polylepis.1